jgi:hypothetical protein
MHFKLYIPCQICYMILQGKYQWTTTWPWIRTNTEKTIKDCVVETSYTFKTSTYEPNNNINNNLYDSYASVMVSKLLRWNSLWIKNLSCSTMGAVAQQ